MEPPISPSPMNAMVESVMVIFSIIGISSCKCGNRMRRIKCMKRDAVRAEAAHRAYVKALPEVRVP